MCSLFENLYMLLTLCPHMVWFTIGTPYIFYINMIKCGWLGWLSMANSMQPLHGALPEQYVPVRVSSSALIGCLHIGILMSSSLQIQTVYIRTFISLSLSLWNYLADPVFDGVGLAGEQVPCFLIGMIRSCWLSICLLLFFTFLFSMSVVWCCGDRVFRLIGRQSLASGVALQTFFDGNKK